MNSPLISIIIPCYNQGEYLPETLQSLIEQEYENWEALIIDDGSEDNSSEIAEKFLKKDKRFKLLKKENGGAGSARNHGLDNCSGKWVQFLDSDDLLHPNKISESISLKNDYNIIITDFQLFKNNIENKLKPYCLLRNETFTHENILNNWEKTFTIPIHCALFEKKVISDYRFNEVLNAQEDWVFWLNVFEKDKLKVTFIDKPYALYRIHRKSKTKSYKLMRENTKQAYLYIFDDLKNDENKKIFFERIVDDLFSTKLKLRNKSSFFTKMKRRIKKLRR
jgi:glycosyltransferase involved in cell wall biosynthesis